MPVNAFDGNPDWRKTRALADGTVIRLRPISPDDKAELARAFLEASPRSRYLRFLGGVHELTEPMLAYLTEVDQHDHIAIVATVESPDLKRERGIGVARLICLPGEPHVAEAAVSVADDMQRRGVGTLLVEELALAAHARGVRRIRADVLEANAIMRAILENVGAKPIAGLHGDRAETLSYDLALEPGHDAHTLSGRLLDVLRGAAQTMAVTFERVLPAEARARLEAGLARREGSGAAAGPARRDEGDRDAERHDGSVDGAPRRP